MILDKKDVPEVFDVGYVDADVLKYHAGFAVEKVKYHLYDADGEHQGTFYSAKKVKEYLDELEAFIGEGAVEGYYKEAEKTVGSKEDALKACDVIVQKFMKKCPAKSYKFYLSGGDNFRDDIATLYKYCYPRDTMPKPKWVKEITQHVVDEYNGIPVKGIEGDDAVAVGITAQTKKGKLAVHLGIDKDVKYGVAGYHYDWKADEFIYTSETEALLFNYMQGIAGDHTDGFHGVKGIGLEKARKLLENCTTEREMYEVAVEAYRKKYGDKYEYTSWDGKDMVKTPEELFLENMRLAYILKEKDKHYRIPDKGE